MAHTTITTPVRTGSPRRDTAAVDTRIAAIAPRYRCAYLGSLAARVLSERFDADIDVVFVDIFDDILLNGLARHNARGFAVIDGVEFKVTASVLDGAFAPAASFTMRRRLFAVRNPAHLARIIKRSK